MEEDGHLEAEVHERKHRDKGVCPVSRKEEGGSRILQYEGTRVWRDRWLEIKFTSVYPKVGIKNASNKMRYNRIKLHNIKLNVNKNGKWQVK
jgi:hypothetical protein